MSRSEVDAMLAEFDAITMGSAQGDGFVVFVPNGPDPPCTEDPELFFAEAPADVQAAKGLCQGCRARVECLTSALDRREPWGVWGGELLLRGTIVPCKRPRGRPRKNAPDLSPRQGTRPPATPAKADPPALLPGK
jgi:WhiB family redox-sensing transcriptional regulator